MPIAGISDHRVSMKQTNEGVNNARTVACQAYTQTRAFGLCRVHSRSKTCIRSKIGRLDTCRPNVGLNAKSTRAFPRVTESTV